MCPCSKKANSIPVWATKAWPAGQRWWTFSSAQSWWGLIWCAVCSCGLPSRKETWAYRRESSKGPWRWLGACRSLIQGASLIQETEIQEILFKHKKKNLFYGKSCLTLEQVAQRGHGVSVFGDIQKPAGQRPVTRSSCPCSEQGY